MNILVTGQSPIIYMFPVLLTIFGTISTFSESATSERGGGKLLVKLLCSFEF